MVTLLGALVPVWIQGAALTGRIVDSKTTEAVPARVYVLDETGTNHFVTSLEPEGSAFPYREQWVPMSRSKDQHTTLSAHPFRVDLPKGNYRIVVYHGKEYFPHQSTVVIEDKDVALTIPLHRWINLNARGWYSGETHVHRRHFELPNVMLAEHLNIAFPVTFWTTTAYEAPHTRPADLRHPPSPFGPREDRGRHPRSVDADHIIVPRNTEYEIFSVGDQRHVLGAVFILNHQTVFTEGMPPVKAIAEQAHTEGALLDLDKHSWPWSLMLPPVAKVDLFELSNNSVWQTRFGFTRSGEPPAYMQIELTDGHMTERGWLDFGFQCYYALLNCGLRLTPTAGTASGVHPVPLGFSRVYVRPDGPFSTESWMTALKAGRSFVTTGPMLFATLNGREPHSNEPAYSGPSTTLPLELDLELEIQSAHPIHEIEVVVNGTPLPALIPHNNRTRAGAYRNQIVSELSFDSSAWVIVRCFSRLPNGRERFAHSAPFYVEVPDRPIRPRREEIDYLSGLMRRELERNQNVLSAEALAEFQEALEFYQAFGDDVR